MRREVSLSWSLKQPGKIAFAVSQFAREQVLMKGLCLIHFDLLPDNFVH